MSRKRGKQHTQAYAASLETRAILDDPATMSALQEATFVEQIDALGKIDTSAPGWAEHCAKTNIALGLVEASDVL